MDSHVSSSLSVLTMNDSLLAIVMPHTNSNLNPKYAIIKKDDASAAVK